MGLGATDSGVVRVIAINGRLSCHPALLTGSVMEHTTEYCGYLVRETISGLDVYDDHGDYACEIPRMTLADFTYDGKISDAELEQAIKDQLDVEAFIDEQGAWM